MIKTDVVYISEFGFGCGVDEYYGVKIKEDSEMIKYMNVDDSFNLEDYDVSYPEIIIDDINIDTFEFGVGIYIKEWEFENFDGII